MIIGLRSLARALNGEVVGGQILCPGPGHSLRDRSLSVRLSASAPDGFIAFSDARDDWRVCRDHVRARLRLPRENGPRRRPDGRRSRVGRMMMSRRRATSPAPPATSPRCAPSTAPLANSIPAKPAASTPTRSPTFSNERTRSDITPAAISVHQRRPQGHEGEDARLPDRHCPLVARRGRARRTVARRGP
jgi:hypothetical protein